MTNVNLVNDARIERNSIARSKVLTVVQDSEVRAKSVHGTVCYNADLWGVVSILNPVSYAHAVTTS